MGLRERHHPQPQQRPENSGDRLFHSSSSSSNSPHPHITPTTTTIATAAGSHRQSTPPPPPPIPLPCGSSSSSSHHHHKNKLQRCQIVSLVLLVQALALIHYHYRIERNDVEASLWLRKGLAGGGQSQRLSVPNPQSRSSSNNKITPKERKQALAYVQSFRSLDRPLKFFHIPKTAGTAIENAAGETKINWGSCMFKHKPKRDICRYPGEEWPKNVGWWHIPLQFFPLTDSNPYQHAELFGVIRDPYDRMVSEFYYICSLKVTDWRPDQCDRNRLLEKDYMNQWLQNKLQDRETGTALAYLTDNGHFTPQYEFVVGPNQVRMIDYVLHLDDSLNPSFTKLMKAFRLENVKLKKFNAIGAGERDKSTYLDVKDLNPDTVKWIHDRYPNDFEEFVYEKKKVDAAAIVAPQR